MTVSRLSGDRVLITLCHREMDDFSLDYKKLSISDDHARRVLLRITQVACRRSGISVSGNRLSIEAMLMGEDCYLLVTVVKKRPAHTYRLKRGSYSVCWKAGSAENLMGAVGALNRRHLYCPKSAVYSLDGEFYLIFDTVLPEAFRRVLSEFAQKSGGRITAARIREYGKPICEHNAVAQIGRYI